MQSDETKSTAPTRFVTRKSNLPDVIVRNEGSVYLFCPLSAHAKTWLDGHVEPNATWFGSALVVEHRYAWALAEGLKDAGFSLA